MELRPELMPTPIDAARCEAIRNRILQIEEALDLGDSADDLIREFNRFTAGNFEEDIFRRYWRSMDLDEFVVLAARPMPAPTSDITRAELVEIARRAMPQHGDPEYAAYMKILDANVPRASTLIYSPADYDPATNTWGGGRPMGEYDPTPEEIVDWVIASENTGPAVGDAP